MPLPSDNLLTYPQSAAKLGLSTRTFYKLLPSLRAKGLSIVEINSADGTRNIRRVSAVSIDKIIARAITTEKAI